MPPLELYSLWVSIGLYTVGSVLAVGGAVLASERIASWSVVVSIAGLLAHALSLGARWVRLGHGPAIGFFEVASGLAFLGILTFVVLAAKWPGLRIAGAAALPTGLLILGATLLANPEAQEVSGTLASAWLVIHVAFANVAFACYAAASVLAAGQLARETRGTRALSGWIARLPAAEELDALTFRLVGGGLLLQGVMIVSGAIWANEAWGRYWGWDPMETWSLVAWAVYALYLHLTLTMGWRGRRSSWLIIGALVVIVFSLLGVPIVYDSVHGAYLRF